MDTLLSLRVFLQVADEGSLAGAAARLGLSRALASKHLMALERRLGTRLVNRTTRRLSLTESGRAFYERSARAVGDVEEAMRCAADSGSVPRGTLRVTAGHTFGRRYVSPALGDYLARHPEVTVDISLNDRFVDIVEEGFDLAIRIGRLEESSLVARRIAATQLLVCATPEYLRRHGTPVHPHDLATRNCLVYTFAAEPDIWTFGRGDDTVRVRVRGCLRANDGETLMQVALGSQGIALLPTFLAGDALVAGTLLPLLPDWRTEQIGIYAVYPSRKHLSAKVRTFVDFLAQRLEPLPRTWAEVTS
jgi:DNA-binding transcriptional LysR family regulator